MAEPQVTAGRTSLPARVAWLLACILAGLGVGYTGELLTGHQAWYLAIPAILSVGWLFLADPTRCEPPRAGKQGSMQSIDSI